MVPEQTYYADIIQKQGLCGIILKPTAQTKWLYTKHITAAVAGKFRKMLFIISDTSLKHRIAELTAILTDKIQD